MLVKSKRRSHLSFSPQKGSPPRKQVLRLRSEFGVYAVNSGRINVAGITLDNMAPLCEAIVAVL